MCDMSCAEDTCGGKSSSPMSLRNADRVIDYNFDSTSLEPGNAVPQCTGVAASWGRCVTHPFDVARVVTTFIAALRLRCLSSLGLTLRLPNSKLKEHTTTKKATEDHKASPWSTFVVMALSPPASATTTNSSVNKESTSSLHSVSDRGPAASRALPPR